VPKVPLPDTSSDKGKEYIPTDEDIKNAYTFKAGIGWWLRFPNGKLKFYKKLPPGARPVEPGKGSGYRSIQLLQKGKKPVQETIKLGFMNINIKSPSKAPGMKGAISYKPESVKRPPLGAKREGKMFRIKGSGLTRSLKGRGRILRK
jgi:hypothetical protein